MKNLGIKYIFKPITRNDRFKCQYNDNDEIGSKFSHNHKICQEHNIWGIKIYADTQNWTSPDGKNLRQISDTLIDRIGYSGLPDV